MADFPTYPPYPVSSFEAPIAIPGADPDAGDFISLCFNKVWLPYLIGCAKQLANPATWAAANQTEMDTVLRQANLFLAQLSEGCPMALVGLVVLFAGDTPPDGWLICDGSAVSRTTYAVLFAVIADTFGVGDGTTTFNLPDMRGRVPVGVGQQSGGTDFILADTGGEETHVLSIAELASHNHTDTGHTHVEGTATASVVTVGAGAPAPTAVPSAGVTGSGSASITNTGSDNPHNNLQPYLTLNYVIKF